MNSATSCSVTDNVFAQYAQDVRQGGGPGSYYVNAFSSAAGQSLHRHLQLQPGQLDRALQPWLRSEQFPYWAAEVYIPSPMTAGAKRPQLAEQPSTTGLAVRSEAAECEASEPSR